MKPAQFYETIDYCDVGFNLPQATRKPLPATICALAFGGGLGHCSLRRLIISA
jgi:hypothetical protein